MCCPPQRLAGSIQTVTYVDRVSVSYVFIEKGGESIMATKIAKLGLKRKSGYLYFIDKQGDVSMAKMARGGQKRKKSSRRRKR